MVRFRPIMMTTMVAILAAVPIAVGLGEGSDLRRPLGIALIGGLLISQCCVHSPGSWHLRRCF